MKNDLYFPSVDGKTTIHAIEWVPEGEPKAVLQMVHGMNEYIDRYNEFASFMADNGFYVVGHDHVGHGESVAPDGTRRFFAEKNGNRVLLADMETVRKTAAEKYSDVPHFILGHSMGSFLVRQFIARHGGSLTGAVIMGTGSQPAMTLKSGIALCSIIGAAKGKRYESRLVNKIAMNGNLKRIENPRTIADWLSKNEPNIDAYISNPWCNGMFTVGAYKDMFISIQDCQSKTTIDRIPKELPLLLVSGEEDPIGAYGKGVEAAYESYKKAGIQDVTIKLYPGDRHEILNELDRGMVYQDLLDWFSAHMS